MKWSTHNMLIIDTNLMRAVTKYDPAGCLRHGHTTPSVTRRSDWWYLCVGAIKRALPELRLLQSVGSQAPGFSARPTE